MQSVSHPHAPTAILAISGSLRRASINTAALRAAALAVREDLRLAIFDSVRELPHFNPDLEPSAPASVLQFRTASEDAAGVLLAVPEYTFGIPGVFKNALDWLVGSGSLYRKPVTVLKVSPAERGRHVRDTLDLALKAHGADVVHRSVPITSRDVDDRGNVGDLRIVAALGSVVVELATRAGALAA
jgi:chromate reductase, NAD(P)H dehydrogenase (quinone)